MCSRFTLTSSPDLIGRHFGLTAIEPFPPRYNIAPTQPIGVVRIGYGGEREFTLVRWGLIPGWVKDPGQFRTLVNARAETLLEKPSFRNAIRYRRCLIPMNGFYEWQGSRGRRQPYYFAAADEQPFAVAGLWEDWMGADGSELTTGVIVTVAANRDLAAVHDRMPAIIRPADYSDWLDWRRIDGKTASQMLLPAVDGFLAGWPVTAQVNDPTRNEADLLLPRGQQDLF